MNSPNLADYVSLAPGMSMDATGDGSFVFSIDEAGRISEMRFVMATPHVFVGLVDFHVERCPNIANPALPLAGDGDELWFTVNYCAEGRCEVVVPAGGFVVVEPEDVCVSYTQGWPQEFRYPLARYRGIELFVSSAALLDPEFQVLREASIDLSAWAKRVDAAAIFAHDDELVPLMRQLGQAAEGVDLPRLKLAFMSLMLNLTSRDLHAAHPRSFLTKGQMEIAIAVKDELERDLAAHHDVSRLAGRFGVGTTTLNAYFSRVYGSSVSAYLRARRMKRAAEMLADPRTGIADIAIACGYTNPSKFSAAFKREHGISPREWRRLHMPLPLGQMPKPPSQ